MFSGIIVANTHGFVCSCCAAHDVQVWLYSIQSEVFSLNNLLCACTVYLAVRCVSSRDIAPLRLGALFVGLCSCNQHTSIFLFTPAIVWICMNRLSDVRSHILSMMCCGIIGLSPYLYLPYQVSVLYHPSNKYTVCDCEQSRFLAVMDNWGEHRTIAGFMHHFLRKVAAVRYTHTFK
jgi:hypothetical protein